MIDRKFFFDAIRANAFGGTLTQGQVDGLNAILDAWEARSDMSDRRWLAYMLATAKWETNSTMQPVREAYWLSEEWRQTNLRYYPWYGRGYVQLTWEANYLKMEQLLGVALTKNLDLALEPRIASLIMFEGMKGGMFTGVGLAHYFNSTVDDPVGARKIINGTDHDQDIARIHGAFLGALFPVDA